jgi:UMP-CMP kinase
MFECVTPGPCTKARPSAAYLAAYSDKQSRIEKRHAEQRSTTYIIEITTHLCPRYTCPYHLPFDTTDSITGAPCSGKSTLCTALSTHHNLEHFSLGNELRELISAHPTGPAALIKPTLSATDIATFTANVRQNTLAPLHLTPKYVKERLFGAGATPGDVRVLVDGFPRDAARWSYFKDAVKDRWVPNEHAFLVILNNDRETARARSKNRGRPGDAFNKRFEEHGRNVEAVQTAMRRDGVRIIEVVTSRDLEASEVQEIVVKELEKWEGL